MGTEDDWLNQGEEKGSDTDADQCKIITRESNRYVGVGWLMELELRQETKLDTIDGSPEQLNGGGQTRRGTLWRNGMFLIDRERRGIMLVQHAQIGLDKTGR